LLGLYGEAFRSGASVLVVLAIGQIVNGATGPVGYLLNMTGHERTNARILSWVVGANLL
jgi:O-antigen/teichoic acid export membrane protein